MYNSIKERKYCVSNRLKYPGYGNVDKNLIGGIFMVIALFASGGVVILIGLIAGFVSGSFIGFLLSLLGGVLSAMIFFALAILIENQDLILTKLHQEEKHTAKHFKKNKTCSKCEHVYDSIMNSCPRCGTKQ